MDHLKKLIGGRVKELRGETSQDALEELCKQAGFKVDRGIIGAIERGATDYRIESLLKIIQVLKADPIKTIFAADPLEKALHEGVQRIYRSGLISEIYYLKECVERAQVGIEMARARSPSPLKPRRPA